MGHLKKRTASLILILRRLGVIFNCPNHCTDESCWLDKTPVVHTWCSFRARTPSGHHLKMNKTPKYTKILIDLLARDRWSHCYLSWIILVTVTSRHQMTGRTTGMLLSTCQWCKTLQFSISLLMFVESTHTHTHQHLTTMYPKPPRLNTPM